MTRLLACIALLQGVALGACEHDCVLKADPVPEATGYDLLLDGEVAANFLQPVVDFQEHPDLWSDEPFTASWLAVGEDGQRSENPSNAVWFNRSCLEHTGEIIDHGAWIERVGCERQCRAWNIQGRSSTTAHGLSAWDVNGSAAQDAWSNCQNATRNA